MVSIDLIIINLYWPIVISNRFLTVPITVTNLRIMAQHPPTNLIVFIVFRSTGHRRTNWCHRPENNDKDATISQRGNTPGGSVNTLFFISISFVVTICLEDHLILNSFQHNHSREFDTLHSIRAINFKKLLKCL